MAENYLSAYKKLEKELANLYAGFGPTMSLPQARASGRLTSLLKVTREEYTKITGQSVKITIESAAEAYTNSYLSLQAASKTIVPVATFGALAKETVLASVMNKESTYNLIKTFKKNLPIELTRINDAITTGIASGKGYAKTAREIQGAFDAGFNDALRVVRTEEGRNWTEGHLAGVKEARDLGLDVVDVWSAQNDGRARDSHLALDGIEADKDGLWYIDGTPTAGPGLSGIAEEDINCRCSLITKVL